MTYAYQDPYMPITQKVRTTVINSLMPSVVNYGLAHRTLYELVHIVELGNFRSSTRLNTLFAIYSELYNE